MRMPAMIGVRDALDDDLAAAFLKWRMARHKQAQKDTPEAREAVAKAQADLDGLLDLMLELRDKR